MIDYEELDERIRRVVREELKSLGVADVVSNLAEADRKFPYTDRAGDKWTWVDGFYWEDRSCGAKYHQAETDGMGPFMKVVK
ncbi:hypothetical protein IU440_28775 [Nocardia cyriacigeorgica]|uniref:hypothetical protein n=1 Tax=Nocardia cyriacigeorgica TaxID=135487 RepID=UPI0018946F99|nr:hypothetical protein [Nocardia cyriacigeorgica]MBF6428673.1 hypothetical protein [Nocardia cyriacigeorgica]